jgi:SAM-dependent methyltransferase
MASDRLPHLNPEIFRYLEYCRAALGLTPQEMKILDFGCGVGKALLALRQRGYQAFGVEIRKSTVQAGREALHNAGYDGEKILQQGIPDQALPFADQMFHFVYSQEVLEHVADLNAASSELKRVTAPNGMGFHVYRPQYNFVEPHFFMPFVHWLPKNRMRKAAILFFAYIGIGLRPADVPPEAGRRELGEFLYKYSVNRTFYRPYKMVGAAFQQSGFDVSFTATAHRKLHTNKVVSWISSQTPFARLLEWYMMTFFTGYLLTKRMAR